MISESPASTRRERWREGIALFNRGEFFECHEVLEAVWLESSGEEKIFLQGLIQVAVSFHHLRRGNFTGSSRLMRAGLEKISSSSACQHMIHVGSLLQYLKPLAERIEAGQASPETSAPEIRLLSAP
ncbi:MAG: DUF309 domain-containing protein [Acidobacteria bacterium]|nr:DUF309 domain-containing protein [Acidobacteriota bacterium]